MHPVILAAGKGSRMGTVLPKTLYQINGKAMLDHILEATAEVPELSQPVIVVGYNADAIKSHVGDSYTFAYQPELNGTAGAVKVALQHLPKEGYVFVLYGDMPFTKAETFEAMVRICEEKKPAMVQSTVRVPNFEGWRSVFNSFARIIRSEGGSIDRIVELKNTNEAERMVTEVNPGIVAIDAAWLHTSIHKIPASPITGEYYLTGLLEIAKEEGKVVETSTIGEIEALGINSPQDAEFVLGVISNEALSR